jgi:phosphohistidine swiveling domain-containing protein
VINLLAGSVLESLGPDDILVLPHETAFHYADWHSLLAVVKAVVSPGRPSHHLAQVARECGVPLVGYISGDLEAIPEGATIHVDGSSGRVRVA